MTMSTKPWMTWNGKAGRWLILTAVSVLTIPILAATDPAGSKSRSEEWEAFRKANGLKWSVGWDHLLGTPRVLDGGRTEPIPGTPEEAARRFLARYSSLFGMTHDLRDLKTLRIQESPGGTHVYFDQSFRGLPVFKGGVDVHLTERNEVHLVYNRYVPEEILADLVLEPRLTPEEASALAKREYSHHVFRGFDGKPIKAGIPFEVLQGRELGIARWNDEYRLAHRIVVGDVRYTLDATSGEILDTTELVLF